MKSLMKGCVLSVAMLILMCGVAGAAEFNAQGGVIVPGLEFVHSGSYITNTSLNLTNITDKVVRCRVTFYDHDGNDISSRGKVYTGSSTNNAVLLAAGTGEYDIPAHSTRVFQLDNALQGEWLYCHAEVQWCSSDSKPHKALIGSVKNSGNRSDGIFTSNFLINNGQPF